MTHWSILGDSSFSFIFCDVGYLCGRCIFVSFQHRTSFASSCGAELAAAFCGLNGLTSITDDGDGCDSELSFLSGTDLLDDVLALPDDTDGMMPPWESNVSPSHAHTKFNPSHVGGCDFQISTVSRPLAAPRSLAADLDMACWPNISIGKLDASIWQGILGDAIQS